MGTYNPTANPEQSIRSTSPVHRTLLMYQDRESRCFVPERPHRPLRASIRLNFPQTTRQHFNKRQRRVFPALSNPIRHTSDARFVDKDVLIRKPACSISGGMVRTLAR